MKSKTEMIVGVDSGDYETVLFWESEGRSETVSHNPIALSEWFDAHKNSRLVFASETSQSAFVRMAIHRGFDVFCTTPLQASLMRKTTFVSGKKDDVTDAQIHASYFRLQPELFRSVGEVSETVASLKLLCNWREQLLDDRIAWTNQIRSHLKDVFPGLHFLRLNLSNQWVLRLLIETPTASDFAKNVDDDLAAKIAKHMKTDVKEVTELLGSGTPPTKHTEYVRKKVRYLSEKTLEHVMQIKECEREMVRLCDALDDEFARELDETDGTKTPIEILRSFPMMGAVTLARIIAEYPEILHAPDAKTWCAYSGGSPITKQSGRSKIVHMRYARNIRLQNAMNHLARNSRRSDPKMNALYARHRAKGKREFGALRAMSRPIIQTLCAMLKTNTLYKPMTA